MTADRGLFCKTRLLRLFTRLAIDLRLCLQWRLAVVVQWFNIYGQIKRLVRILNLSSLLLLQLCVQLLQISWSKRRDHVLLAIGLLDKLVVALSQLADLLLGSILGRGEQEGLVIGIRLQMFDFLLTVQHLPALDAEHFSVRLGLDGVESHDELIPLGRVALNHLRVIRSLTSLVCLGLLGARFFGGKLFLLRLRGLN